MSIPIVPDEARVDVLVLGSGGAGLMAALYAADEDPGLEIVLATKGLFGKSGCTRMVQGGYNVVFSPADSLEQHFLDTMRGGHWINNAILARTLVDDAPLVVREMERKAGVYFARDANGNYDQKGLAGQAFDRTVHHGDLTGIEIVSRLSEQVRSRGVRILEETRVVDLLTQDGEVHGAVLLGLRTGGFTVVRAAVTVLATGGSAPVYSIFSASLEKSGDGYAVAFRAGARLLDMEMAQFHPTGLIAPGSHLNGSVIAEELRGLGGRLYNAPGERFMERYAPERLERATRDEVARASYREIVAGRGTENGGVWLDVSHLGAREVELKFPGMLDRCLMVGRDLRKEPIEVCPTSHFHMGGVEIDRDCVSNVPGLLVAGEDAGGVHGANRLGGNGVADSTVYGRRAGLAAARIARERRPAQPPFEAAVARATRFWRAGEGERPHALIAALREVMWSNVGVLRDEPGLAAGLGELESLQDRLERTVVRGPREHNLSWAAALDADNAIVTSRMIATAARMRTESRGAHARSDFPEEDEARWRCNIVVAADGPQIKTWTRPPVLEPVSAG